MGRCTLFLIIELIPGNPGNRLFPGGNRPWLPRLRHARNLLRRPLPLRPPHLPPLPPRRFPRRSNLLHHVGLRMQYQAS